MQQGGPFQTAECGQERRLFLAQVVSFYKFPGDVVTVGAGDAALVIVRKIWRPVFGVDIADSGFASRAEIPVAQGADAYVMPQGYGFKGHFQCRSASVQLQNFQQKALTLKSPFLDGVGLSVEFFPFFSAAALLLGGRLLAGEEFPQHSVADDALRVFVHMLEQPKTAAALRFLGRGLPVAAVGPLVHGLNGTAQVRGDLRRAETALVQIQFRRNGWSRRVVMVVLARFHLLPAYSACCSTASCSASGAGCSLCSRNKRRAASRVSSSNRMKEHGSPSSSWLLKAMMRSAGMP